MLEIHNFTQNQIDQSFFQRIADAVLKELKIKSKTEISLAIVGNGRIRKLNKIYRGKNRVTDVLSFSNKSVLSYLAKAFPRLKKGEDIEFVNPPDKISRLGEIIISYPQAKKQARKKEHSLEKELTILFIHGILHLLGYDHEKNIKQAEQMEKIEEKILGKF